MVGPTGSGKTVYAASLFCAADCARRGTRLRIKVRYEPSCAAAKALSREATRIMCGHRPLGTSSTTVCQVWVDLSGSVLFGLGRESLRLTVVDLPGGDCMPPTGKPVHPEVRDAVRACDSLIVVVPVDNAISPGDMRRRLRHLVDSARGSDLGSPRPGRFLRVAVAMTKSELLAAGVPESPPVHLDRLSARDVCMQICGKGFVDAIAAIAPKGGDWYSLVSAFGFDVESGEVLAEKVGSGWRLRLDDGEFQTRWSPYRVFEPLEFIARGVCWQEKWV